MKRFWLVVLPFLSASLMEAGPSNQEVVPGVEIETVYEILGEPRGVVGSERFQILHFPRGEVYIRSGVVERAELITQEELEAREARARELELARERERQERLAKGRALRDEKLADESFQERSPRDRLAFWRTFQRHYPQVDVEFELEIVRAKVEEEERARRLEQQRQEQLLALQRRVRDAEIRAAEVEMENRRLEEEQRRLRDRPRITHVSPIYVIRPDSEKPPEKDDGTPPSDQPQTRPPQREVRGAPPSEPTPFERARQHRLERSNIRSAERFGSS